MRVLFVHSALVPPLGGAEAYVLTHAESLRDRGHDVRIATRRFSDGVTRVPVEKLHAWHPYEYEPGTERTAAAKLMWHGVNVFNPTVVPSLSRVVRRFRPDVVHTNNFQGLSGAVFPVLRSVPHVHTVHDYSLVNPSAAPPDGRAPALRLRNKALASLFRPDMVLFPSETAMSLHQNSGVPAPGVACDVKPFGWPSPIDGPPVPRDAAASVRFLFLGQLIERKGVRFLLEVWKNAAPRHAELSIAGDGPLAPVVAAAAEANPTLRYVGWADRRQRAELFAVCDVLVQPSDWEVCSIAQLEAILSGAAVLTTPAAASPYARDGYNATILERDESAWACAINELSDRARVSSIQAGARETAPRVEWGAHVDDVESVYERISSWRV